MLSTYQKKYLLIMESEERKEVKVPNAIFAKC